MNEFLRITGNVAREMAVELDEAARRIKEIDKQMKELEKEKHELAELLSK